MYDSKYMRYITKSQSRFAETDEIVEALSPATTEEGEHNAGIPLYYDEEGEQLYVDTSDNHSMVIGFTGCKKTRTTVFPTVISIIKSGESGVFNDPKGELYIRTASLARQSGADVYVLNLRDPLHSDGWNPFTLARRLYSDGKVTEASQVINDFTEAVCADSLANTNDRYWIDVSKSFLSSLIHILVASMPEDAYNIINLLPFCYECNSDKLQMLLKDMDQTSGTAMGLHAVVDLEAEKTKSCVYSSLLAIISPFMQNRALQTLLSHDSFCLSDLDERQTLIYIIYPDEKETLSFLVNAFLTQCYEALVTKATENGTMRLKRRVNFVLEEFSNLPAVKCFDNRISESRSRNIRYFIFIQSFEQLKSKYGGTAETILSNCGNWLCFCSKEMGFVDKLCAICGKEVDYNGIEHPLITPFDMQHLVKATEYAEALIIRQGIYPYIARLRDIDYIPDYSGFEPAALACKNLSWKERIVGIDEWYKKVMVGVFDFPFPSESRRRAEGALKDRVSARLNELKY